MKKLFLFIVVAIFAAVSFSACSDDKDDNISPSEIVGTWELVHIYYEDDYEGEDYIEEDYDVVQGDVEWQMLSFKADGTFTDKYDNGIDTGNYSINGNKIMMEYDYDDMLIMTIKTHSSKTLVLEEAGEDDKGYYKVVYTFKRI